MTYLKSKKVIKTKLAFGLRHVYGLKTTQFVIKSLAIIAF